MKNLILVSFLFLSTVLFGQAKLTEKSKSYTVNKELAKAFFERINEYRSGLKLGNFVWSESWYNNSLTCNLALEKNNAWWHSSLENLPPNVDSELIVGFTYMNNDNNKNLNYKYIADSCLNQLLHSPPHKSVLLKPLMTEKIKEKNIKMFLTETVSVDILVNLSKYGSVSCIASNYGEYTTIKFIIQLSQDNTLAKN